MTSLAVLAAEHLTCPTCSAPPGQPCVTVRSYTRPAGCVTTWPHAARTRPLEQAHRQGMADQERYYGRCHDIGGTVACARCGHVHG